MTVSDLLRISVENTKELLHKELLIQKGEAQEILHFASLEKIFIEKRIYKDKEFEESRSMDEAIAVSYTHLRAHETGRNLVCRLLLEKKN